jgi:hypothetical protein
MGCCCSSLNRVQVQHSFTTEDILCLTQTWSILKTHDIIKFADEVLIRYERKFDKRKESFFILFRTMNQSSSFRYFWTSKIIIDANNYDFSQGESCLRTDLSWHIGIREHSVRFISTFDKLLSSIKDENLLLTQIRSLQLLQNLSILEYNSLTVCHY